MPARAPRTPAYRHHKPSGQAVVTLGSRDYYLGRYGTPESCQAYDRLLAEWLAHDRRLPATANPASPEDVGSTVNELILAYLGWAQTYYVKGGRTTQEVSNLKYAMRPLRRLYGPTPAREFSPGKLKAVRQAMIDDGLCRNEINRRVRLILRAFKWCVAEEMVPPSVHQALQSLAGLRRGRSAVRESRPVKPVPEAFVDAIQPYVSRQVWAMVGLQRLTGMRPGEVVSMRSADIDTSGRTWMYTPRDHKTEHHDKTRSIHLGPRAQGILGPWLSTSLEEPLFSPAAATAERRSKLRSSRRSPVQPSQRDRAKPRPRKRPGDAYTVESYRRAIAYGCKRAGVPAWSPNRLRHNAATWLRKEFGLDVARVILGHSSTAVTEVYAEVDQQKAIDVMAQVG